MNSNKEAALNTLVLIPAYNESKNILPLISNLLELDITYELELIVAKFPLYVNNLF